MMEIITNKEEVKSVMNIIQAFADGKNIDTDMRFGCLAWGIKPKKD